MRHLIAKLSREDCIRLLKAVDVPVYGYQSLDAIKGELEQNWIDGNITDEMLENMCTDPVSLRVGSAHTETIRNGRSFCNVCGFVDDCEPTEIVLKWHGDSFNDAIEGRCEHGMFRSGIGACPACGQ